MANSNDNGDYDSLTNPPFPRELLRWPVDLDIDDDEFRAGYPFDNISELGSNECEKSNNSSLIPDHDVCELNESNNDYISEEEEEKNKQTIDPMYEEQKIEEDVRVRSSSTVEHNEDQELLLKEINNQHEQECDGNPQHSNIHHGREMDAFACESFYQIEKHN